MTRMFSLNVLREGISRLKIKGSPDPQTLYDLLNGYVTPSNTVEARPGCRADTALPPGTRGLMSYRGYKYVFSDTYVDLSALPKYRCAVLKHKDPNSDATLVRIHFAEPFLLYPYVVAEWSDGEIFHYWLQGEGDDGHFWQPDTTYRLHAIVLPSTPTGFAYRANRLGPPGVPWAANAERDVDDVVEPTTPNGFEYVAIEAFGNPPRSAAIEPNWPTEEGAIVVEEADLSPTQTPPTTTPPTLPPDVGDRYGRGGGGDNSNSNLQAL